MNEAACASCSGLILCGCNASSCRARGFGSSRSLMTYSNAALISSDVDDPISRRTSTPRALTPSGTRAVTTGFMLSSNLPPSQPLRTVEKMQAQIDVALRLQLSILHCSRAAVLFVLLYYNYFVKEARGAGSSRYARQTRVMLLGHDESDDQRTRSWGSFT